MPRQRDRERRGETERGAVRQRESTVRQREHSDPRDELHLATKRHMRQREAQSEHSQTEKAQDHSEAERAQCSVPSSSSSCSICSSAVRMGSSLSSSIRNLIDLIESKHLDMWGCTASGLRVSDNICNSTGLLVAQQCRVTRGATMQGDSW